MEPGNFNLQEEVRYALDIMDRYQDYPEIAFLLKLKGLTSHQVDQR